VPLLAGVLLGDLQLQRYARPGHGGQDGRHRLAHLEVERAVLDLHDHVVGERAVQRVEVVVRGTGAVGRPVAPVLPVVVHERAPVDQAVVGLDGRREHVRAVGVRTPVGERPGLALGVGLDDEPAEVRDRAPHPCRRPYPPVRHAGVERVRRREPAEHDGGRERDRQVYPDAPAPEHGGDPDDVAQVVGQQARLALVHVDVVDRDAVDPYRGQQPCVPLDARQVGADETVVVEDGTAGVATFHLPHHRVRGHVVPVVEHAQARRGRVGLVRVRPVEGGLAQAHHVEQPVQQPGVASRLDHDGARLAREPEALVVLSVGDQGGLDRLGVRRPAQRRRQREHQLGVGHAVAGLEAGERTAEPGGGRRHLLRDGSRERAVARHHHAAAAQGGERVVGQPGRVGHGKGARGVTGHGWSSRPSCG
jgi:hypothetical protein